MADPNWPDGAVAYNPKTGEYLFGATTNSDGSPAPRVQTGPDVTADNAAGSATIARGPAAIASSPNNNPGGGSAFPMSPQDRDIAIRTMLGEEGDPMGLAGVASTMINRAKAGTYGGTSLKSVALSPGQFEPWSARPHDLLAISPNDPKYIQAGQILDGVASGQIPDYTNGATYFYAPAAQSAKGRPVPPFAKGQGVGLGSTLFYAPNGANAFASTDPFAFAAADVQKGSAAANKPKGVPQADPFAFFGPSKPAASAGQPSPIPAPAAAASSLPQADPFAFAQPRDGAPGSFPLGDPRNQGRVPDSYKDGSVQPSADVAPVAPVSSYLLGQAKAFPGELARDAGNAYGVMTEGVRQAAGTGEYEDPEKRQILPSFPSINPYTWGAGGLLKAAGGALATAYSPVQAAIHQFVGDPVNQLTGGPQTVQELYPNGTPTGRTITYDPGERAELAANMLSGGGIGGKTAQGAAAAGPASRAAAGIKAVLGERPPPELVNRFTANPDLRLMDDPSIRAHLLGQASTPGTPAFNILSQSAKDSADAAPGRVSGAFDASMGVQPNVQKLLADLDQKSKDNAAKAFGDAFAGAKPVDISGVIDNLSKIERPGVNSVVSMPSGIPPSVRQQAATNIKSLLTDENGSVITDPVRLGEIQSDLRKQAAAEKARGGMTTDILTNARQGINDALDAATGGKYSAARLQYRNDKAVPEAFQVGFNAFGGTGVEDRPEFLQAWRDAPERTPEEIQAALIGMRTRADNVMNGNRFSARNGGNITDVPFNVDKANILKPGEGDALAEKLKASRDIAATNKALFEGSPTASRLAAQAKDSGLSNAFTAASAAFPAIAGYFQGANPLTMAALGAGGYALRKGAQAADAAKATETAKLAVMPGAQALRAIYGSKAPSAAVNLLSRGGGVGAAGLGASNKLVNPPGSPYP